MGLQLLRAAGLAATYTPPGGVPVATFADRHKLTRPSADGHTVERVQLAYLPTHHVPDPRVGALLQVGGLAYTVEALESDDGAVVGVIVKATP